MPSTNCYVGGVGKNAMPEFGLPRNDNDIANGQNPKGGIDLDCNSGKRFELFTVR
jgi:hypothetical protein